MRGRESSQEVRAETPVWQLKGLYSFELFCPVVAISPPKVQELSIFCHLFSHLPDCPLYLEAATSESLVSLHACVFGSENMVTILIGFNQLLFIEHYS